MTTLLREPLLHFLLLGGGMFTFYSYLGAGAHAIDERAIVVDESALLRFVQYRSRMFSADAFRNELNGLSKVELRRVVDSYVREEALYREAKALGLDKNDYVARLRLVQQLEFIMRGLSESKSALVTDREVDKYFLEHRVEFYVPGTVTFSHVFFSAEGRGIVQAEILARRELQALRARRITFDRAEGRGDRFLYYQRYVHQDAKEIANHFGSEMQRQIFSLDPSDTSWRGPFRSTHGYHLVMLTEAIPGYEPPLSEVKERIERTIRQSKLEESFRESIQSVVKFYTVDVKLDLPVGA